MLFIALCQVKDLAPAQLDCSQAGLDPHGQIQAKEVSKWSSEEETEILEKWASFLHGNDIKCGKTQHLSYPLPPPFFGLPTGWSANSDWA